METHEDAIEVHEDAIEKPLMEKPFPYIHWVFRKTLVNMSYANKTNKAKTAS